MELTVYRKGLPYTVLIDDEDLPIYESGGWNINVLPTGVMRVMGRVKGRQTYLHREIVDYDLVDHINGNSLDNRKCNLRDANKSINGQNTLIRKDNTSGVKGVSFRKSSGKWKAQLVVNNKHVLCKLFSTKEEAINARKEAEELYHPYRRKSNE